MEGEREKKKKKKKNLTLKKKTLRESLTRRVSRFESGLCYSASDGILQREAA